MAGSWLFWAVSSGLAALGTAGAAFTAWRGLRATEAADGMVVGLEEETDSDGATLYRAVVVFTAGGAEHRAADPMAWRPAAHRVGQRVRVWHPPGRPDLAQIGRWRHVGPFLGMAAAGWGCLAALLLWLLR
jgi:hypothetical protein